MLSIIIVNYKTASLTLDCVRSVFAHCTGELPEVIVVDNHSDDGLEQLLAGQFPDVQFVQMGYNAGFARANNKGIAIAKGDCLLLLNSDTVAVNNDIMRCYATFKSSDAAACGIQLLNADGSLQVSGYYNKLGGLNFILQLPFSGRLLKGMGKLVGASSPGIQPEGKSVEVDWINGAFLMTKKSVIEKAGLLDEDFFLYSEETEWCSRLRKYGKMLIYGQFSIIHLQGESAIATFGSKDKAYSNLSDRKGYQIMLSSFVRIRKEFGLFWFTLNLLLFTTEIPFYFLLSVLPSSKNDKRLTHSRFNGYCRNLLGIYKHLPTIIANKKHFYKVL